MVMVAVVGCGQCGRLWRESDEDIGGVGGSGLGEKWLP